MPFINSAETPTAYDWRAGPPIPRRPPMLAPPAYKAPELPHLPAQSLPYGAFGPTTPPAPAPPPQSAPPAPAGTPAGPPGPSSTFSSGQAQNRSALDEARRQAIIRFGDPELASMAGFGLDPQAAAFARQNYLSGNAELARLDKANQFRRRAIINRLAGRGLLGSGDYGYLQGEEAQYHGNTLYDARNRVLDYLGAQQRDYLDRENQLRAAYENSLRQSQQDSIERAYANWFRKQIEGGA